MKSSLPEAARHPRATGSRCAFPVRAGGWFLKLRRRNQFQKRWTGYLSPSVINSLIVNPEQLEAKNREVTILTSDIANFPEISESLLPDHLITLLNKQMTATTRIILQFNGTINEYTGDWVSCFWGAPVTQPNHALQACRCALEILEASKVNVVSDARISIRPRIGISSGIVFWGGSGQNKPMDYRLAGDAFDTAKGVEILNKEYGTQVLTSETTYGIVQKRLRFREVDLIQLDGKSRKTRVYELLGEL